MHEYRVANQAELKELLKWKAMSQHWALRFVLFINFWLLFMYGGSLFGDQDADGDIEASASELTKNEDGTADEADSCDTEIVTDGGATGFTQLVAEFAWYCFCSFAFFSRWFILKAASIMHLMVTGVDSLDSIILGIGMESHQDQNISETREDSLGANDGDSGGSGSDRDDDGSGAGDRDDRGNDQGGKSRSPLASGSDAGVGADGNPMRDEVEADSGDTTAAVLRLLRDNVEQCLTLVRSHSKPCQDPEPGLKLQPWPRQLRL